MMPKRGASLWVRENVGSAAISTSHLVKLGSARIRTCRGHRPRCWPAAAEPCHTLADKRHHSPNNAHSPKECNDLFKLRQHSSEAREDG